MVELSLTCLRWIFPTYFQNFSWYSKLPSIAVAFDLKERRVGRLMKKMCPNKQMNCIGKYRRNLINMDETVTYFYFEKVVFLVELIFMSVSTNWEEAMGLDAIFWMFNSIVFAQSVIQTILQCLILSCSIGELDGKDVNDNDGLNFYVTKPRVLEPRRFEYPVGGKSLAGSESWICPFLFLPQCSDGCLPSPSGQNPLGRLVFRLSETLQKTLHEGSMHVSIHRGRDNHHTQ